MRIKYFESTDTLYIELYPALVEEICVTLTRIPFWTWTPKGASVPLPSSTPGNA